MDVYRRHLNPDEPRALEEWGGFVDVSAGPPRTFPPRRRGRTALAPAFCR